MDPAAYTPPRPKSLPAIAALLRALWRGDGNLLGLLPNYAYDIDIGELGYSRRSTVIVNAPEHVRTVLNDAEGIFPKSDLMVNALEPLIGDSIFVSSGATWRRQRAMIDPAFSAMRINRAFTAMTEAVDAYEAQLDRAAAAGDSLSLDLAMSELTADIICRTVFSTSLQAQAAKDVFDDFSLFERSVAQVKILRLIWDKAWTKVPQEPHVLAACQRIRAHLDRLIAGHLGTGGANYNDLAATVIAARAPGGGSAFTKQELIDQLGVFFLAGHETTASALTWAFFIIAQRPDVADRMRAEVLQVSGDGPVTLEHTKALTFTRNVFRETLRLYPPITFLPRVANRATCLGARKVKRGALMMVAPWTLHRHRRYWRAPDSFDPDRFAPEREKEQVRGAYIPFGQGPRICAGAAFATVESVLILARLVRRYDFTVLEPEKVRPAARLTTRPEREIALCVHRRG